MKARRVKLRNWEQYDVADFHEGQKQAKGDLDRR